MSLHDNPALLSSNTADTADAPAQSPSSPGSTHHVSQLTIDVNPPPSQACQASRNSLRPSSDLDDQEPPSNASSHSSGTGSFQSDSLLQVLDDQDEDVDEEMIFDEETEGDVDQPLVPRSGRRRRRRRNAEGDSEEKGLFEVVPSLILAHGLPLFPLLAIIPYDFLPAGVVLFVPIICILAVLSASAHVVIVYLAWYLKVSSFEDVFSIVTGRFGLYGLWTGRITVIVAVVGILTGWLSNLHYLLQPIWNSYAYQNAFFTSVPLWTILASMTLLPSLMPARMTRPLRRVPWVLTLVLPVVAFLVIGRTVEITKANLDLPLEDGRGLADLTEPTEPPDYPIYARSGITDSSSAIAGLTTLTVFFSPHVHTLPFYASVTRAKRGSFPIPCLIALALLLTLSLPLALVPYYLLPSPNTSQMLNAAGVFAQLPSDDGWVNVARALMCALTLGSSNMWILRGRDAILKCMGVDRSEIQRAGKWIGLALWSVIVLLACIGGWVAEKVEMLGVLATLAIGWLLPSIFFIITFHVRSPLSIIFPSSNRQPAAQFTANDETTPPIRRGHGRTDSLNDPSTDALLARKERQLQRRRLGRRLWQDLVVYVGVLPIGIITVGWTLGHFLGIW